MNILIIEDSATIVNEVSEACKKINSSVTALKPFSYEFIDLRTQLEELCQKNKFDLVLLDYMLWSNITGDRFTDTLKTYNIPIIAFSGNGKFNSSLINSGAISSIDKDNLRGSRGFKEEIFLEYLTPFIPKQ